MLRVVRRTARQADVVVVLPHWGTQYTHVAEPVQRRVGRALVGAGADLVVGGHPHWVQGVDAVRGVPVLHSLGNFVFDMDFMEQTMQGVVLEATFWGAGAQGGPAGALPDGPGDASRPAGSAAQRPRGSSTTCGRPAPDRSPPLSLRRQRRASQATTVRAVRPSWARSTTAGTSPAEW